MNLSKNLIVVIFLIFFWCCPNFLFAGNLKHSKFSLDVSGIEISDLLKIISQHANKNIVVNENVSGKVTLKLREVFWREALDAVLSVQGLVKHETKNVIVVLSEEELKKTDRSILQQRFFSLRHVVANEVLKVLKGSGVLSVYGKAEVNQEDNTLVATDWSDNLKGVEDLLKRIDVPSRQLLIEARIVTADEAFIRELGLEFIDSAKKNSSQQGRYNFTLARFSDNSLLDLKLTALENDGRGRVISKPKLLATDRKDAYIEAGSEIPYQEKTKEGNTSVVFKKAVLSLTVTPEIVSQDAIKLNLQLNQDKVGHLMVNGVPTIDTRKIQTQALVRNNETIVLGGIYEWSKSIYETGIPLLKDIPWLKILFSKRETKMERRELLIFVTPRII